MSVRKKEGLTIAQTAVRFCVGIASVTRWVKWAQAKAIRKQQNHTVAQRFKINLSSG
ncbi:MAG: hypothetical protein KF908_03980 [Nitrosomonas sp.]|nr:hypothetical protein [Nitrosomonas sp.]MCW5608836.1 hypothetical protein [Nitrosomonas sp.]